MEHGGNSTGKISDETWKKISESNKGRESPNKGKPMSEEQKIKISIAKTGQSTGPRSVETKRKISEANVGKTLSEETRKKLSDIRKECWQNEDYRLNQVEKHKWQIGENHPWFGKNHTDETKEKIGQANTKACVFCIELNMLFKSSEDAKRKTGVDASDIRKVCRGIKESTGKHPITGEKLHWIFIEKGGAEYESIIA